MLGNHVGELARCVICQFRYSDEPSTGRFTKPKWVHAHKIQHEPALEERRNEPLVQWLLNLYRTEYVQYLTSSGSSILSSNWEAIGYHLNPDKNDDNISTLPPWIKILCLLYQHSGKGRPGALLKAIIPYGSKVMWVIDWIMSNAGPDESFFDNDEAYHLGAKPALVRGDIPILDKIFVKWALYNGRRRFLELRVGARRGLDNQVIVSAEREYGACSERLLDISFCCDIPFDLIDDAIDGNYAEAFRWIVSRGFTESPYCTHEEMVIYLENGREEKKYPNQIKELVRLMNLRTVQRFSS